MNERTLNSYFVYIAYIEIDVFFPAFQCYDVMTK
jgi:hypothetical protein